MDEAQLELVKIEVMGLLITLAKSEMMVTRLVGTDEARHALLNTVQMEL